MVAMTAQSIIDRSQTKEPQRGAGKRAARNLRVTAQPVLVEVSAIQPCAALRLGGLNEGHVQILAELDGEWPPILISRESSQVIDGQHRVAAAQCLGMRTIAALIFDGDEDAAYIEFLRRNTTHGLPLSFQERQAAGRRLVAIHPEWSDRRVASLCALDPKTVSRLRLDSLSADADRPTEVCTQLDAKRIGRDGRARPVDRRRLRRQIEEELLAHPDASLRTIARAVGASPETVRSLRSVVLGNKKATKRVPEGTDIEADVAKSSALNPPASDSQAGQRSAPWACDPAFASGDEVVEFSVWFERVNVEDDCPHYAASVPLSRVYEIADEARRRAHIWSKFAESVEARARRSGPRP